MSTQVSSDEVACFSTLSRLMHNPHANWQWRLYALHANLILIILVVF